MTRVTADGRHANPVAANNADEQPAPPHPTLAARLLPPALLLCVVGIVFYLSATSLVEQGAASGTPITNSALYPRLLAGLLLILTALQIGAEISGRGGKVEAPTITRHSGSQLAGGAAAVLGYLALLPVLGYAVSTLALVAGLLVLLGDRAPLRIALYTAALTVGCAAVFQGLFNVNLPRGLFGLVFPF